MWKGGRFAKMAAPKNMKMPKPSEGAKAAFSKLVPDEPAVTLKPAAKRAFIAAYERRLDQEVTHPVFGYRVSTRRLLEVQSRLLTRYLCGEIDQYPHYLVR